LPEEYDEEVKKMVKTIYDPKVEARGEAKGEAKGKIQGKTETLIKLLQKKFGSINEDYIVKINKADIAVLDDLLLGIFDLKDIKDIEKYLN
jgi:hypothetical protein